MLIIHAIILAILGLSLLGVLINLLFFRSLGKPAASPSLGRVSILVPARNEERSIAQCVSSLLAQDYRDFEIIVLNDSSSDRTGAIAEELLSVAPRHRLLTGAPLPDGWVGKNWACHQLSQAATGDWLIFTDADTVHSPSAISAALTMSNETGADLLSAWPRLVTVSLGEKMIIPVLHVLALAWTPLWILEVIQARPWLAARAPRSLYWGLGAANGQFLVFRRGAYQRIGGHEALRNHIVEDLALGREVSRRIPEGMRLVNCDASALIDCRMYHSFIEVCDGFTKNVRAAFEGSFATYFLTGAAVFTTFLLPFILLFFPSQYRLALMEVAIIYLIRIILTIRMRTSWLGCLLHPFGEFFAICIGLRSGIHTSTSGVQWKGRTYRPDLSASSSASVD